jgi:hypothetical protein
MIAKFYDHSFYKGQMRDKGARSSFLFIKIMSYDS